ncbi:hypothetical protein G9A89_017850 [Geosiphon pyriformis]|nr:hypothetical protein G9A89_017850 [Geosiphon pyriformis]
MRNTSGNCKDSLREDPRQWVDFSSASEKEYINTHNNQELKNNLHHNSKKKAFSVTEKTKVATKTPNLTVLEFCRAIYTQNQSDLGLPEGCCPAESALTYYINARINYHIGKEEEPHGAKLGLYRELSQYTTKEVAAIAATIQYANENFPISTGNTRERTNKTKENLETNQESNQQKLKTPAQTPKKTVTQSIKKQRIYSPEDKSYHFSPENKIQIPLGAALSSTSTSQTPKTPSYIVKIKQCNWGDIPITGGYSSLFQNPLFQPKFRTGFENHEEESESESEKETSKKTITRPVTGTSSQSKNQETRDQEEEPDIREATFRNTQGNIIPPPLRPINSPAENGNKITTPYIARLTDFSEEEKETDVHTWLREAQKAIQANNWNDQKAIQTLPFFLKSTANSCDPNAVIQLQNEFNTIKQNTDETVTQYLARFNRIHRQIEVIEQGYYTDPQVLNQFIRGLKSSILGRVRSAHPNFLPEAVTLTRALESAKKEANYSQMVNMVMEENKTETLEKRVTRLGKELSKKIESYLISDLRKNTYQPPQRRSQEVSNSRNNRSSRQEFRTETCACHFCKCEAHENNYYAPPQMPRNQYTPIPRQYPTTYQNQGAYQQQPMIVNPNWRPEARNQPMNPNRAGTNQQTNPNYQNYQQTYLNIPENLIIGNNDGRNINRTKNSSKLSQTIPPAVATEDSSFAAIFPFELEENETMFSGAALDKKCPITAIYTEATQTNPNYQNYQQTYLNIPENLIIGNNDGRNINRTKNSSKLSQTIPPAVATEDSSFAAIFPFELEENETMFSGAALDKKCPITAIYTEATVNNTPIKLILDSGSAGSIVTLQLVNQLGFKVDRATTFQIITANGSTKLPYGEINSFSFEINGIVIPTKVLVMDTTQYQVLVGNDWLTKANATLDWTTKELLINYNGHQAKIPATCGHFQKPSANQKPTFKFEENPALPVIETYQLSWADDQRTELPAVPTWTSEERSEWNQVSSRRNHQRRRPKLECSVCKKKLSSMTAYSAPDEDPRNPTHYYCNRCNKEKYSYLERHGKWDEEPCLACEEPLPRGCDWNDLPGRGGTCDTTCQYTILICDWVRGGTPFEAAFNRALKRLQHYPHNEDKLYNTTQAKSAEVADKVASYNMFDPVDEFQDYYQQLCPTQQEQKQYLVQINTYLCENCLIPCQSQCCEECQDERNLERKMEIENQQSQNQSINQQDSPDGPESEKFVAYTDLEQVTDIQYFDNRHLEIIPERAHPTDAEFDLHYLEDQSTTLPPRSITKIDLKIAVEIPPGIMVQMAIQEGVINSRYTGNLMVLLQNNSEKPYTIESKEKIAQAIFLSLVKIGKFVSVENREKLSQTTRGTFGFGSTGKGIEANFAETIGEKGERNTSGNCKDSLREDPRQWVDFSSVSEKEYINTYNNQELKNNLHRNSKKKAFSVTVTLSHK